MYYTFLILAAIATTSLSEELNYNVSANEITDNDDLPPEVEIDSGKLIGTIFKTAAGRKAYAFLGVPYAAPPINEFRFKDPQPVTRWDGVRAATDLDYNSCLQINHYRISENNSGIHGDEDCLYLNVYTPKLFTGDKINSSELLDVMVYIHGGAFMFANGKSYKPKFLLDKTDLVFVSINYRLGPLGFMTLDDELLPGNNGLKDQVFALKWVKNNILKFGGDANKITIAGMSAGGASVHYHYLSKLSRDLFNKGISVSGVSTNPWALMESGRNKTIELAKSLNCETKNSSILLQCLKGISGYKILEKVKILFIPWLYNPFTTFGPTVEIPGSGESFLDEHPYDLIKKGDVKNAPWLLSVAADEGLYPGAQIVMSSTVLNHLDNNWYSLAPHLLDFNFTVPVDKLNSTSKKIRDHYFENETININTRKKLIDLLSDRLFLKDIGETIKRQAVSTNNSNIYLYKFSFRGKYSVSDYLTKSFEDIGVSHGDDLPYVLGCYFTGIEQRKGEKELMEKMVDMWLSFMKSGKPEFSVNDGLQWNPISTIKENNYVDYVDIKSHQNIVNRKENNFGDWKFWDSLDIRD